MTFLHKQAFNRKNGMAKQLKMREIKVERAKRKHYKILSEKWFRFQTHKCDFPAAENFQAQHPCNARLLPLPGAQGYPTALGKGFSHWEVFPKSLVPLPHLLSASAGLRLGNTSVETCLQLWAGMFKNVLECVLPRQEKPRTLGNPQRVGSRVRWSWWQVSQIVTSEFRKQSREHRHGSLISVLPRLTEFTVKVNQGEAGLRECQWHFI